MGELRVANAPISYGAFELTVDGDFETPDPDDVLDALADAGYSGTELGPPGYLGEGPELRERLRQRGLELVGAFVPIRFARPDHCAEDLERELAPALDALAGAGATGALVVLADAGSPERRARPGHAARDRTLRLDEAGWRALAKGVERSCGAALARGFEPVFHHHGGSYVEAPAEIERLLERTDVRLALDTGHLFLGGGEPLRALRDWGDRVAHVHLKDVRMDVLQGVLEDGAGMVEAWRRGVFCELGTGEADVAAFVDELTASAYRGWLVVEQDRVLARGEHLRDAAEAQVRNRRWLLQRVEAGR